MTVRRLFAFVIACVVVTGSAGIRTQRTAAAQPGPRTEPNSGVRVTPLSVPQGTLRISLPVRCTQLAVNLTASELNAAISQGILRFAVLGIHGLPEKMRLSRKPTMGIGNSSPLAIRLEAVHSVL